MSVQVTVDRIEGEWAVLESPAGTTFDVPVELLPEGTAEGDVLTWGLQPDPEGTAARRERLAERFRQLTEEDDGGDLSL